MTTQTPEADAAEVRRREWAERLVLSFLTPSGGFVHPSQMVETLAAALRSAEKDAARGDAEAVCRGGLGGGCGQGARRRPLPGGMTVDFEAKAREVCDRLSVMPIRASVDTVADALRAAALDDDARHEARAELTRLLAELRAPALNQSPAVEYPGAVPWDTPAHSNPVADIEAVAQAAAGAAERYGPSPLRPLYGPWRMRRDFAHALERLLWLLGLCEGERRFVAALADDAADFDLYSVYADWLEDQGRTADGARVRRLVPKDGDVLVWRMAPLSVAARQEQVYLAEAERLRERLAARDVDTTFVVLPHDAELSALDPDAMRAAGWVRAEDVRRALRDVADDAVMEPGGVDDAVQTALDLFPLPGDAP